MKYTLLRFSLGLRLISQSLEYILLNEITVLCREFCSRLRRECLSYICCRVFIINIVLNQGLASRIKPCGKLCFDY